MKRKRKKSKEELERISRQAENHPTVRRLRDLEARGWAELEARGSTVPAAAKPGTRDTVRLLRELETRGRAELEERRRAGEAFGEVKG